MGLRFIESLDPVLHSPDPKGLLEGLLVVENILERRLQAKLELMLSILFGERIVVSEPYSFDSVGFLEIATEVLQARPQSDPIRKASPVWDPFSLALWGHTNFTEMLSARFNDVGFILSGWSFSDENQRKEVAKCFSGRDYQKASKLVNHEDEKKIYQLEYLDKEYFSQGILPQAGKPNKKLSELIISFMKSNQGSTLAKAIQILEKKKDVDPDINLDSRSLIFKAIPRHIDDPDIRLQLAKLVNLLYTSVVGSSVRATDIFLTTRNPRNDPSSEFLLSSIAQLNYEDNYSGISLSIEPRELLRGDLLETFGRQLPKWERIWEIVTDTEWYDSIKELRTKRERFINKSIEKEEMLDAYARHVDFLAKYVTPLVPSLQKESLVVKLTAETLGALTFMLTYRVNHIVGVVSSIFVREIVAARVEGIRKGLVEMSIRDILLQMEKTRLKGQ